MALGIGLWWRCVLRPRALGHWSSGRGGGRRSRAAALSVEAAWLLRVDSAPLLILGVLGLSGRRIFRRPLLS